MLKNLLLDIDVDWPTTIFEPTIFNPSCNKGHATCRCLMGYFISKEMAHECEYFFEDYLIFQGNFQKNNMMD